jgi:hypothetical protein
MSSFGEGVLPCVPFYRFPLKSSRAAHRLATGRKKFGTGPILVWTAQPVLDTTQLTDHRPLRAPRREQRCLRYVVCRCRKPVGLMLVSARSVTAAARFAGAPDGTWARSGLSSLPGPWAAAILFGAPDEASGGAISRPAQVKPADVGPHPNRSASSSRPRTRKSQLGRSTRSGWGLARPTLSFLTLVDVGVRDRRRHLGPVGGGS